MFKFCFVQGVPGPVLQAADHLAAAAGPHRADRLRLPDCGRGPGAVYHRLSPFLQGSRQLNRITNFFKRIKYVFILRYKT